MRSSHSEQRGKTRKARLSRLHVLSRAAKTANLGGDGDTEMVRPGGTPGEAHPAEQTLHTLLRALGRMRQAMEPYFARQGISGPQWAVLRALHRAEMKGEGALRLKDIGEKLFIRPPSVTGVIDRMERMGFLRRSDSRADLRVRRVELTTEGKNLLDRMLPGHPKQIANLFRAFSEEELGRFTELLEKWEGHLKELTQQRGLSTEEQG